MLSKDIQKKVRLIQIKTKKKLNSLLSGNNNTSIKGEGYNFDQVREYSPGDDIRYIDFKSSARLNKLCTRQYLEERNRNVIIFVDVSASNFFSSSEKLKIEVLYEIACVIALVANACKDKVGVCLFSDKIVKFIPPSSGDRHINYIMGQLFTFKNDNEQTNIELFLKNWIKQYKQRAIIFLISDFVDISNFEKPISALSNFSDVIAIKYNDVVENALPKIGLIQMQDIETNQKITIDTSHINLETNKYFERIQRILKQNKIDILNINNKNDCITDIIKFFNKRFLTQ